MKKFYFSLLCLFAAISMQAAELNIFATNVSVEEMGTQVTVSYDLNAPATAVTLQLLSADNEVLASYPIVEPAALTKGSHMAVVTTTAESKETEVWAIKAQADTCKEFAEVTSAKDAYRFYSPQGVVVNKIPASPYFGKVYVAMPNPGAGDGSSERTRTQKAGLYVFDALLNLENEEAYQFGLTYATGNRTQFRRIKMDKEGNLYVNRQDSATCIYKINPANMDSIEEVITNSAFTKIAAFAVDGDVIWVLDYGTENAVYKLQGGVATKIVASTTWINTDVDMATDGRGGVWIAQNRWGADSYSVLTHVKDSIDFKVDQNSPTAVLDLFPRDNNFSQRGTLALNSDKSILAFGGNKKVSLYGISYNESTGVPSLDTVIWRSGVIGGNIDGITFDAVDNLYFQSASTERLYVYSTPKEENAFTTPMTAYKRLEKPAPQLNIFASQVAVAGEGTDLEIHYVLNAKANELALVLVEDATGNILSTNAITDMAKKTQGKHQFNISVAQACAAGQHWAIQASAAPVTELAEVTNDSTDAFRFYLPQGIAVNNNPESKFFGQVYVTMPYPGQSSDGGSARTKTQKAGMYVFDATLKAENDEAYQFGLTFANNRKQFKRVAVDADDKIYVSDNQNGRIICINPKDMSKVESIIQDAKAFTAPTCVDVANGVIYALDNPNTTDGGSLIKIEDGTATKIIQSTLWANADDAVAYDKQVGGVWVSQYRDHLDAYAILTHVSAEGTIDFTLNASSAQDIKDVFGDNVSCYRGSMALNVDGTKLALGHNKKVVVYNVSYNETTKVPILEKDFETPVMGANIDGVAFDAVGNLYAACATTERLYVYSTPKADNSFISPATSNEMPGTIHVDSIVVTPKESTPIEVGDAFTFSAAIFPANATDKSYTWSIADTAIATISEKGVVTAVAKGVTKVFAVSNDNPAAIDSAVVNVIDKIWYYPNIIASRLALTPANTEGEFLVEYTLNAPADSVKLILKDVNEKESEIALKGLTMGANSETVDLSKLNSGTYTWSIKASAPLASEEDAILSNIGSQDLKLTTPRGVVVDNNPASPYFGEVYVTDSKNLDTVAGFYVYDPTLVSDGVLHTGKWGAANHSPMRIVIGEDDGLLYISDWSDIAPNIHIVDPANLDEETLVFGGNYDATGMATNEAGDSIHGSMSSCWVRGKGAERVLYTFDEDMNTGLNAKGLFQYNIGELATPWVEKPSAVVYDNADNYQKNGNSVIIPDAFGGWWISQDRATDGKEVPALIHMNASDSVDFVSGGLLGGRTRGALAFNADQSVMVSAADNAIIVWIVEWDETTKAPSIKKDYTIGTTYGSQNSTCLFSLALDAALNIYAVVANKPLQVWASIVEENTTNIPGGEVTLQNAGQGIQEISNEPVQGVRKEMRDGQLIIIRDNKEYNAIGAQL